MKSLIFCLLVAYVGSRALLASFDFQYRLFSEPFHFGKAAIDLGVFLPAFFLVSFAISRLGYKDAFTNDANNP